MKINQKYKIMVIAVLLTALSFNSCTKLTEVPYDQIVSSNFLQTKQDVVRDFIRSFEHGYYTIQTTYEAYEDNSDELITPYRDNTDWFNGGIYERAHYHTWITSDQYIADCWNYEYQGIDLATNSMEDIQAIDPANFGLTAADKADFLAELQVHRAWFYIKLLDLFRNIEIITQVQGVNKGTTQSTPQQTFSFIESQLLTALPNLPTKASLGVNGLGRWTQAGCMALLARLYLNAKVYTGTDRFADCATVCQDIINGKYGSYAIDPRWDGPFDYNNGTSPETIFAFPSSFAYTHWQYTNNMYYWSYPHYTYQYFGFTDYGIMSEKYSLSPGRDVYGNELPYALGKPFVKFQKYPDDVRLLKYQNLGNSKRQGMFLFGNLPYVNASGATVNVQGTQGYTIYLRDAVGNFKGLAPGVAPADPTSDMNHADQNSGLDVVKYPFYPSNDPNKLNSAFAEIRMAEIYYDLAECKYRAGDKAGASVLLNTVRARYYPAGSGSLYKTDGSSLTDQEMLDEWGREFIVEGRRRMDMIRWGVFNTGTWWDKQPDADSHTAIFPIPLAVLNINPQLKQNPGY
jgi:hypothetical protein